jgi:Sulfotransferase family
VPETAAGPLFIVSMWRGGSSLFHVLLNKHPQVGLTYEADLLLLRPLFAKPDFLNDWPNRWEFWNNGLSRHGLNPADFAAAPAGFQKAFEAVHRAYAQRKGATIWGDKSPNYYDQLVSMARAFPEARFIVVWRNPRETISAAFRAAAGGSRYFRKPGMALRSLLGYRMLKRQCRQVIAEGIPVHQLRYEELVSDTEGVMRKVCDFLQISYDESLSKLEGSDRSAIYAGEHHNLLRGDIILREPRPDVIPPRLRKKIERYLSLWQDEYKENWQTESTLFARFIRPLELQYDLVLYRLYRALDFFIRCCFCFVPVSWLRTYRSGRDRMEAARLQSGSLKLSTREQNQ